MCIRDRVQTASWNGITIRSLYFPEDAAAGKRAAQYAKDALAYFSECYGKYPYKDFTVAETRMSGGAMEYPQLIMMSYQFYRLPNFLTLFDEVIAHERPDWVLVQGDTTTVMVASLVAYYHRVRVGHVEAGLRTEDKWQPYPEEINRRLTDVLADLYFAPTERNRQNLLREGVAPQAILVTGNTVVDALLMTVRRLREEGTNTRRWSNNGQRLILVTAHRRENFGHPLTSICRALVEIAARYASDVQIVYPVHPNPNVLGPVHAMLSDVPNVTLVEPLDYFDFVQLMDEADLILTDSGGLQEEAPSLGAPVLVMRDVTERPEGVEAGVVKLVGTDERRIVAEVTTLLEDERAYRRMTRGANPYGDGRASQRIVEAIRNRSEVRV